MLPHLWALEREPVVVLLDVQHGNPWGTVAVTCLLTGSRLKSGPSGLLDNLLV